MTTDKPIYGVQYALTWGEWTPCIANWNSWADSRVEQVAPLKTNWQILAEAIAQKELERHQMDELDVILDEYVSKLPTTATDIKQAEIIEKNNLWPLTITDMNGKTEVIPTKADQIVAAKKEQTPAQAIKIELKKLYPAVKFSCRYSTFSMWDSVNVSRQDWPTEKEVDAIIGKYQYWHFDGMTDYYDWDNHRDDIPQAKYVSTSRSMSPEVEAVLNSWALDGFSDSDKHRYYDFHTKARNLFRHYSITSKNIEVIDNGATCYADSYEKYEIISK